MITNKLIRRKGIAKVGKKHIGEKINCKCSLFTLIWIFSFILEGMNKNCTPYDYLCTKFKKLWLQIHTNVIYGC